MSAAAGTTNENVAIDQRTSLDDAAWHGVVRDLHVGYLQNYFPDLSIDTLLEGGQSLIGVLASALRLDRDVPPVADLSSLFDDTNLVAHGVSRRLNFLHVEPLLGRAAALLDRALIDRAAWNQLNVECFRVATELVEFLLLDEIHKLEEAAGYHSQARLDHVGLRKVEEELHAGRESEASGLERLVDNTEGLLSDREVKRLTEVNASAALNSHLPFYKQKESPLRRAVELHDPDREMTSETTQDKVAEVLARDFGGWRSSLP